ncbi:phage terminase small subunit [Halalkalibacterium halodurans]|uniref:PBSX phage terminase small subunit-like N-terminal domain-containing protein n=1 Tax=Halalkalibacterium halodurans TaxID=86665 RepID=A0A0M0KM11_ALKHA|nr:phage terminase small subunit [Halalkalibacterium halodurans]TPE70658.1 terminase [Halalkalibacterium halodurans]
MARPRDPRRDEAKEAWLKSNGEAKLKDIATYLGVSASTIRKWKAQDRWEDELKGSAPKSKRSAPKQGAPKGNDNAKGNKGGAAPKGNKNAVGNSGGAAPRGNKNALTTGEYESILFDTLTEEEQELFSIVDTSPVSQIEENIRILAIRERRMLQRINDIIEGMTEKEVRILKQLRKTKVPVEKPDFENGGFKEVIVNKEELVVVEEEETTYRKIDDILKIEDALTRVQNQKQKAIKLLFEMTEAYPQRTEIALRRLKLDEEAAKKDTQIDLVKDNVDLSNLSDEELEKELKKYGLS